MHKDVFSKHIAQHCVMPCLRDRLQLVLQSWLSH